MAARGGDHGAHDRIDDTDDEQIDRVGRFLGHRRRDSHPYRNIFG